MLCARRFNGKHINDESPSSFFLFLASAFRSSGIPHQAGVTRTSVSLLNVKFVGVLSTVTVITPNQYSADGCQRGTSHLISPHLVSLRDDTGNYPTIRRREKTRSVAGSSTEFSEGGGQGGRGTRRVGNRKRLGKPRIIAALVRWTGEGTGGRSVLNKSRR